jgi:hypothetical protein
MKRRLFAVTMLGACATLAVVLALWLIAGKSRIDPHHFQEIEVGMARATVEQVLGGPPRNECSDPVDVWVPRDGKRCSAELQPGVPTLRFFLPADVANGDEAVWVSENSLIAVRFDADGRVVEKYMSDVKLPDGPWRSPIGAIARWLQR